MKYEKIRIQGFRSFEENVEFSFGDEAGLYLLTGDNQKEPSLEANGSGKSSISEALVWLRYGKTSVGQRGDSLRNWKREHKTCVKLFCSSGNKEYIIERHMSPNKITVTTNGEELNADQAELDCIFQEGYDSFLLTTVLSQFGEMFFDFKPAAKLQIFSDALQLSKWVEYSSASKYRCTEIQTEVDVCRSFLFREEGVLQTLENTNYEEEISSWESEEKEKLQEVVSKISDAEQKLYLLSMDFDVYNQQLENLAIVEKPDQTIIEKYRKRKTKREQKLADIRARVNVLREQYKALNKVELFCPTCKREYENAQEALQLQKKEQEHITASADVLKKEEAREISKVKTASQSIQKALNTIEDLQEAYYYSKEERSRLKSTLTNITVEEKQQQNSIDNLTEEKKNRSENPYKLKQEVNLKSIKESKKELDKLKRKLSTLEATLSSYAYWVKGFKNIQLFLVEEALTQLEMEVNSALDNLGLSGWKISFVVESENTSKTISKGFKVVIQCPHNKSPIPWESWSGGEKQRLKLAGTLGMTNLLLDRRGITSNLEIYDEPTQGMSGQGILDTLDTLRSRALLLKKRIWIVDHHAQEYGGYSKQVTVIKDDSGSHL